MKANIYIDGGNLYFGLLKGRPEVKWPDLDAFCRRLVGTDHELNAKCQLPDAIPVGTHGNFIRRPEAWK